MEWPIFMDIRTRPREIRSLTGTRDLQMVNISLRTLSRPDPTRIVEIYRRLGPEFDEVVLLSIGHEVKPEQRRREQLAGGSGRQRRRGFFECFRALAQGCFRLSTPCSDLPLEVLKASDVTARWFTVDVGVWRLGRS